MAAKSISRLFRLLALYARMDLLAVMASPKIFWGWAISDAILNLGSIAGMLLLAERFGGIGVWNKYQIYFLLGYAALVEGVINTLFGYNIAMVSRRLGRGQFDHTIIQPQPIWLSLLTEGFNPVYGFPTLVPGAILIGIAVRNLAINASPGWCGLFVTYLVASTAVMMAFQFAWGSMAFWQPRAAEEISSSTWTLMSQLKGFPLEHVGVVLHGAMLTVLPVGFLSWLPCRTLLGFDHSPLALLGTPVAAMLLGLLASALFLRGKEHYGRIGASRYNDMGHRR